MAGSNVVNDIAYPGDVLVSDGREEGGGMSVGSKVFLERAKHCNEVAVVVSQGKDDKSVDDVAGI